MKRLLRIVLPLFLLSVSSGLRAMDFTDVAPANSLMVLQLRNVAEFRERWEASPMGIAVEEYDWEQLFLTMALMGQKEEMEAFEMMKEIMEEGEDLDELELEKPEEIDPEEFRQEMAEAREKLEEMKGHFTGSMAVVVGDMREMTEMMIKHAPIIEELYKDVDWESEEDEDPVFDKAFNEEMRLEALQTRAIAKDFWFLAEVEEGEKLLETLSTWIKEELQEQEDEEIPMTLETLEEDGLTFYHMEMDLEDLDEEEYNEEDKALLKLEPQPWWTVNAEGVFVFAVTEEGLRKALAHLDNPPAETLSTSEGYQQSHAHLGESDLLVYLNLPALEAPIRSMALAEEKQSKAMNAAMGLEEEEEGPMDVTKLMDWLALDALLPISVGMTMEEDRILSRSRFGFSRESALARILVDPSEFAPPQPAFIHKDLPQVSLGNWSLKRFYEQIEKEAGVLMPEAAAGLMMGRMMLAQQIGLDPKLQLIDHLGTGIVAAQEVDMAVLDQMLDLAQAAEEEGDVEELMAFNQKNPTNGQYYLIGLQVANRDAVSGALNTLLSKLHPEGLPEPADYKGVPIHSPIPKAAGEMVNPDLFTYAFLEDYLVLSVGSPRMLHRAVDALKDPDLRLWKDADYLELRDSLPAEGHFLEYNSGAQQAAAMQTLQRSVPMMMGLEPNSGEIPDFSKLGTAVKDAMGVTKRSEFAFETVGEIRMNSEQR